MSKEEMKRDLIYFLCGEKDLSPEFLNLLESGGMDEMEGWNIKNYLLSEIDSDKNPDIYFKLYFLYQYKLRHGLVNYKEVSFWEDIEEEDFVKPNPSEFYSMDNYPRDELDEYCSSEEYYILADKLYPQSVDEAIDILLNKMSPESIRNALKKNRDDFCTGNHWGLGLYIRNQFGFHSRNCFSLAEDIHNKGGVSFFPDFASQFLLGELWDEINYNRNSLHCDNCGFDFYFGLNNLFYYNHITKETVDFNFDFSKEGLGFNPYIKGYIKRSYCNRCDKYIDTYVISEINCLEYDKSEISKLVSDGIKTYKDNYFKRYYWDELNYWNDLKENLSFVIYERGDYFISKSLDMGKTYLFKKSDYFYQDYCDSGKKKLDYSYWDYSDSGKMSTYSKDKIFIDIYLKSEKSLENYFKNIIRKNEIYVERRNKTFYAVDMDISDNESMLNLIKCEIQDDFTYHLKEKDIIKCPVCNQDIYEEFFFSLSCPICGNDLRIKR